MSLLLDCGPAHVNKVTSGTVRREKTRAKSLAVRLGAAIRALRIGAGHSQEALADLAGIHRTYIGAVERGERNITVVSAERVASALGVRLSELLRQAEDVSRGDS